MSPTDPHPEADPTNASRPASHADAEGKTAAGASNEASPDTLPPAWQQALAELDAPPAWDADTEQAMLTKVQQAAWPHLQQAKLRRNRMVKIGIGTGASLAAAACLLLFVLPAMWTNTPHTTAPMAQQVPAANTATTHAPNDLNHDGQVNILDAYLMQQHIDQGQTTFTAEDVQTLRQQIVGVVR